MVLREVVNLRKISTAYDRFPLGREYRVFLYNHEPLAHGFYWEEQNHGSTLEGEEEGEMLAIAIKASRRLNVPFLSVDVGQLETGEWIVIEVGDAQFSGLSQVSALHLWNRLVQVLDRSTIHF